MRTSPASSSNRAIRNTGSAATTFDPDPLILSCDGCPVSGTSACDECIVPLLCGASVQLGVAEARTLVALQSGGLAPKINHPARQTRLMALATTH